MFMSAGQSDHFRVVTLGTPAGSTSCQRRQDCEGAEEEGQAGRERNDLDPDDCHVYGCDVPKWRKVTKGVGTELANHKGGDKVPELTRGGAADIVEEQLNYIKPACRLSVGNVGKIARKPHVRPVAHLELATQGNEAQVREDEGVYLCTESAVYRRGRSKYKP